VLEADEPEGPLGDETEMAAGLGPASEGAVLAETILTAAVSFFVLKTVVVLPLPVVRLLLRMGALGPDILTVVVMRGARPPPAAADAGASAGEEVVDDDDDDDDDDDEVDCVCECECEFDVEIGTDEFEKLGPAAPIAASAGWTTALEIA
jgi:hypothetical protein